MLLGFKTNTWRGADAYNHHHVRKDWKWDHPDGPPVDVTFDQGQLPSRPTLATGEVVVRVAVSYRVAPVMTQAVVPNPLAEVDIAVAEPSLDVVTSRSGVDAVVRRFREGLDAIEKAFPNARMIHVFAAVPPAVAFRLGTNVSPTIHARIQTYELDRAGPTAGYYPALVLQDAPALKFAPTEPEAAALGRERDVWQEELGRLQGWARELSPAAKVWTEDVEPSFAHRSGSRWDELPRIPNLRGMTAAVDLEKHAVEGGFAFNSGAQTWRLDDTFLLSILRRIPDEASRRCAIRLFLLHESVHDEQCLTASTAAGIGRFGKVLEELDYQADVWALLHEYRCRLSLAPDDISSRPCFLRGLVSVVMETMMAFDDAAGADTMQARRISRYLTWSWQYLELERAHTLEDCLTVMFEKPILEIYGLRTWWEDERLLCSLRPSEAGRLEVALLRNGQLHRYGLGTADRLDLLLEALRQHKPEEVYARLRAIADRVLFRRA